MAIDWYQLFHREHPFYTANAAIWRKSLMAYGGGGKYIQKALIRHISEIEPEYLERLQRACYVNFPRRIATLITQYVFANKPTREGANPDMIEDFSRTGLRVDEVMRQFSTYLNICGCAWLAVDMPIFSGVKSKQDELTERLRPYCVAISPLQVVDWCYGADGLLDWVLVAESAHDNSDPWRPAGTIQTRKLWTRESVSIVSVDSRTGERTESVVEHNLGLVPFIRHTEIDGYEINENHWFEDVVRISDAIFNAQSEAQMNIVKQMFGLLVIPEDFLDNVQSQKSDTESTSGKGEPLSHTLARSAAIFESAEGKGCSRYISPSGTETAVIRAEIDAMKKDMFSVVGLASSKDTKMVETAEAKAWDFQNVEHYMQTRADILEQCETRAWQLMSAWNPALTVPKVVYNRNFAILDLKESVATLLELSGFNPQNDEYQREIGKTAVVMLDRLKQVPAKTISAIMTAISDSTPGTDAKRTAELVQMMQGMTPDGGNIDASGIVE